MSMERAKACLKAAMGMVPPGGAHATMTEVITDKIDSDFLNHNGEDRLNYDSVRTNPASPDVVAMCRGYSEERLSRGQVGTIVEELDAETFLVEFAGLDGIAYSIAPVKIAILLGSKHSR